MLLFVGKMYYDAKMVRNVIEVFVFLTTMDGNRGRCIMKRVIIVRITSTRRAVVEFNQNIRGNGNELELRDVEVTMISLSSETQLISYRITC